MGQCGNYQIYRDEGVGRVGRVGGGGEDEDIYDVLFSQLKILGRPFLMERHHRL